MKNKKFTIIFIFALLCQLFSFFYIFENSKKISYDLEVVKKDIKIDGSILKIHFEERSGYQKLHFQIDNSFNFKTKIFNRIYIYYEPVNIVIFH